MTTPGGPAVALFGAYGHTGRFVADELVRRGLRPILCGRDAGRLATLQSRLSGVEARAATLDDAVSLDHAVAGAAAVVNCAGPFLDTAVPVIEAALRAAIHYIDVAAEQEAVRRCQAGFDAEAKRRDVTIVPAMGFYGGLGDLLATWAMRGWSEADEIVLGTALSSWHPTLGTRRTGTRNVYPRVRVEAGELAPVPSPPPACEWRFPEPFGVQRMVGMALSEIITIHSHLPSARVMHYLNERGLDDVRDPTTPTPEAVDAQGRSAQRFTMVARVRRGGTQRQALASGQDIYAVTAPLVGEAVERLLSGPKPPAGIHAPGAVFDAEAFLQALAPVFTALECREEPILSESMESP